MLFLVLCLYLLNLYMSLRVWFKGYFFLSVFLSLIRGGQILFDSAAFYTSSSPCAGVLGSNRLCVCLSQPPKSKLLEKILTLPALSVGQSRAHLVNVQRIGWNVDANTEVLGLLGWSPGV